MSYFEKNIELITKRWPDISRTLFDVDIPPQDVEFLESNSNTLIYKNTQISSSYDSHAEATVQCQQVQEDSSSVHLYGIGIGIVQNHLLQRDSIKSLNIYVLNIGLFKAQLTYFDHSDWLQDKRVQLSLALTQQIVKQPFIVLPADLVLADDSCAIIRDRLQLELDHGFIQKENSLENSSLKKALTENTELIEQDGDITQLSEFNSTEPVFIAAAGPTLECHFDWLLTYQKKQKGQLIAVDSAVKPLLSVGIVPDYIVSIDPIADRLFAKIDMEKLADVPLIYFPLLQNDFLCSWKGKRYVSASNSTAFEKVNELKGKTKLFCAGSVLHPAVDLAVKRNAKKVVLLGADFSLVDNKSHVIQTEVLTQRQLMSASDTPHWVLNGHQQKVPTYLNFRGYLRDLELYIAQHPNIEFFNGSLAGAEIMGAPVWHGFNNA